MRRKGILTRFGGLASRRLVWALGLLLLVAATPWLLRSLDGAELARAWRALRGEPLVLAAVLAAYACAFCVRAAAWARLLPGLRFGHALAALHVALAGNHLLPLRLGEALRVTSVVRRAGVALGAATASTVALRGADLLAVALLAAVAGALATAGAGALGLAALALLAAVCWAAGLVWLRRLAGAAGAGLSGSIGVTGLAALAGWVLEAPLVWQSARWAGVEIGFGEALVVTAITIAAQVLAVAPGGLGTYEAAAAGSFVALGAEPGAALAAALTAHALKTAYALAAGLPAALAPAPGLLGRVRLGRPADRPPPPPAPARAPVVLFLPAHDEEETVADVVRRVPTTVGGRRVQCLVVDDGSGDRTSERAAAAGAEVVSLGANRGLGAAVRRGLDEALARGAAAVAFCDADGEYAPEELERLVLPILAGEADYVVGSRFRGEVRRMLLARRLGNLVLTALLSFVARARISDGQSGYRALSARAAAEAEVIHDFNYAQVLTLDLLGKGFRYGEVPIGYEFRRAGRSFVRLLPYLRRVVPAVHRELNAA